MKRLFLLASAILFSTSALANFSCHSTIKNVLVYGNGSVNITHTSSPNYTYICNVSSAWKGISPATCNAWVSTLTSAQLTGAKVAFYYSGAGSCSTLASYGSAPAPVYIGIVK